MKPQGETSKAKYIQRIRLESAYPVFRKLVRFVAILLYIAAVLTMLGGIIAAVQNDNALFFVGGFALGLIYYVLGRLFEETSSMIADIADSITDYNCRHEMPPPEQPVPPPVQLTPQDSKPQQDRFEFHEGLKLVFGGVARTKAEVEQLFREFLQDQLRFLRTWGPDLPDHTNEEFEEARRNGFSKEKMADLRNWYTGRVSAIK